MIKNVYDEAGAEDNTANQYAKENLQSINEWLADKQVSFPSDQIRDCHAPIATNS